MGTGFEVNPKVCNHGDGSSDYFHELQLLYHLLIVRLILKDILSVYTSEHNMADSSTAKLS